MPTVVKIDTIEYDNDLSCTKGYDKETRYQRKAEMAADSLILFTTVAYKMTLLAAVFMMVATLASASIPWSAMSMKMWCPATPR